VQDRVFQAAGPSPNYYMTVMDAGVIKRYVELGFGIGIISSWWPTIRCPRPRGHQSGAPVRALPGPDLLQQEHPLAELHV
jgi:DNA-binding transcriptional LysR family regulator